jgi:endonuclease I
MTTNPRPDAGPRRRASLASLAAAVGLACQLLLPAASVAQPPAGYYDGAEGLTGDALKAFLHDLIDDHNIVGYDCCRQSALEFLDEDPENPANVVLIYNNASAPKSSWPGWNAEHSWPQSLGAGTEFGGNAAARSDLHHIFAADSNVNSSRNNKYYDYCVTNCEVHPEALDARFNDDIYEPPDYHKGDVARALFYMATRYNGDNANEPMLTLGDVAPIMTGCYCMGNLATLLEWHLIDPVDDKERLRNDKIFYTAGYQGNRNPFIDHPEWVCLIFGGAACLVDGVAPDAPTGLVATPAPGRVRLDWANNLEPDLYGYNIYRAATTGGPYLRLNTERSSASDFVDKTSTPGVSNFYAVSAVDVSGNESFLGPEVSAAAATTGFLPWINEFHYDNASTDVSEFVEIAGPAGFDLAGWSVVFYNGLNGQTYMTTPLSGVIPDQQACFGTLSFLAAGIQNGGAPEGDGLALVGPGNVVLSLLSYEGAFTATNGPAMGMASTNIGVDEEPAPAAGLSLRRIGRGSLAEDFFWANPATESPGAINDGETFEGDCGDFAAPNAPLALMAFPANRRVSLDWVSNVEGDLAGYNVYRSTVAGGPYQKTNISLATASEHLDRFVQNGTTYYYVVTAVDAVGNESTISASAFATPTADSGPPPGSPWINEFHYDNQGADSSEIVEIAARAGTDLANWRVVLYNGGTGMGVVYQTINLSGVVPDQQNGFGMLVFSAAGAQNGPMDGLALVDAKGVALQFLSYEGVIVAMDGPAAGQTSIDMGVSEAGDATSPVGASLQLGGSGRSYADFAWQSPLAETPAAVNRNQTFLPETTGVPHGVRVR